MQRLHRVSALGGGEAEPGVPADLAQTAAQGGHRVSAHLELHTHRQRSDSAQNRSHMQGAWLRTAYHLHTRRADGDRIMWQDPIVTETRQLRELYASQFAHNADAIFEDILRRQSASGRKLVSFPPRKPILAPIAAQPSVPADPLRAAPSAGG